MTVQLPRQAMNRHSLHSRVLCHVLVHRPPVDDDNTDNGAYAISSAIIADLTVVRSGLNYFTSYLHREEKAEACAAAAAASHSSTNWAVAKP